MKKYRFILMEENNVVYTVDKILYNDIKKDEIITVKKDLRYVNYKITCIQYLFTEEGKFIHTLITGEIIY